MYHADKTIRIFRGVMNRTETWRSRAVTALPYLSTLYYVEVMLFAFFINFLYGKPVAVVAGAVLTVLVTAHVLLLFNESLFERKIQLLLMDFHFAWSSVFVISRIFSDMPMTKFDFAVTVFRGLAAIVELPVIILITKDGEDGTA